MTPEPATQRTVRYRGVTKSGRRTSGSRTGEDLSGWIEKKWRQGYRWLEVTENGEQVAGISTLDGAWWSE